MVLAAHLIRIGSTPSLSVGNTEKSIWTRRICIPCKPVDEGSMAGEAQAMAIAMVMGGQSGADGCRRYRDGGSRRRF